MVAGACGFTISAVFDIALGIDAKAVAEGVAAAATDGTCAIGARFVVFTCVTASTAVERIMCDVDAIAIAPIFFAVAEFFRGQTLTFRTDLRRYTGVASFAAVVVIDKGIDANIVNAGVCTASLTANFEARFTD